MKNKDTHKALVPLVFALGIILILISFVNYREERQKEIAEDKKVVHLDPLSSLEEWKKEVLLSDSLISSASIVINDGLMDKKYPPVSKDSVRSIIRSAVEFPMNGTIFPINGVIRELSHLEGNDTILIITTSRPLESFYAGEMGNMRLLIYSPMRQKFVAGIYQVIDRRTKRNFAYRIK